MTESMSGKTREERSIDEQMNATQTADGWAVATASGSTYTVDLNAGTCSCMDATHRGDTEICKHKQYVMAVVGLKRVPVEKTDESTPAVGLGSADHVKVEL